MTSTAARDILALNPAEPDIDAALKTLLDADPAFAARLLATVSLPGLGRRSGIELDDLRPLFGLRFVQQVAAGLLLEEAGADATGSAILAAIAAQAVASRISLPKGEEVFLAGWLNATPAWRQAPPSWGPGAELIAALDRHVQVDAAPPMSGARPDLIAQAVRLGEALAALASPYPDVSVVDVLQRAARLGLSPREFGGLCDDIARHAEEWGRHLGRALKAEVALDLGSPEAAVAARFAGELAEVYRYLLQNAAIDAETGLPNARYFRTRLESEWAAARRRAGALSVMAIICLGDAAGVARTLRETARMQDVVCRTGDAHFMVICVDTQAEYAEKAAARIQKSLAGHKHAVSLGVATLDSMISSVDDLIERAQAAAREAQASGKGYRAWQEH
ncbi:MAG: diguanylate cyclase [Burkholderiales bacterium]|nr:diguanylate cyclase [Burkholderiales bacterium]